MDMSASHQLHAKATPARVAKMCEARPPEDVAADLGITVADVMALLDQVPSAQKQHIPVTVYCLSSGRTWNTRGWRGAYLLAQMRGLAEWGWCSTATYMSWREAQA